MVFQKLWHGIKYSFVFLSLSIASTGSDFASGLTNSPLFPLQDYLQSQHPAIYSSYAVVSFCLLICCCSRIVSFSLVNQLYFANHPCFCEPPWKVTSACRFSMRSYRDIGRVLSSFMFVILSSAQESVWCGERSTDHGPNNILIKRKNEGCCIH